MFRRTEHFAVRRFFSCKSLHDVEIPVPKKVERLAKLGIVIMCDL